MSTLNRRNDAGYMGMLGIPDAAQFISQRALYPPKMGCCRKVSDEFVGRSGFGSTMPCAVSDTEAVTSYRPGSRSLL